MYGCSKVILQPSLGYLLYLLLDEIPFFFFFLLILQM